MSQSELLIWYLHKSIPYCSMRINSPTTHQVPLLFPFATTLQPVSGLTESDPAANGKSYTIVVRSEYCRSTEWSIIKLEIMPILWKLVHMLLNVCQVESNNRKGLLSEFTFFSKVRLGISENAIYSVQIQVLRYRPVFKYSVVSS